MQVARTALVIALASGLGACASTPPVSMNYYLPKGVLKVDVARTVGCDAQDRVYIANLVTSTMLYSADYSARRTVRIRDFDSPMSNLEAAFTFTEDGRLSGLNTTQTGQGSEIIKSALAIVSAVIPAAAGSNALHQACEYIKTHGKDNVLTLKFAIVETFGAVPAASKITAITEDQDRYGNVVSALGDVCLITNIEPESRTLRAQYVPTTRRAVKIPLRQPALVNVEVRQGVEGASCSGAVIWKGTAQVPQQGPNYELPVPAAALFGKQTVKIGLTESGALTSITYGKDSGLSGALGSVSEGLKLTESPTAVEEAADLKAQADIIFQNERLIKCRADPSKCI